MFDTMGPDWIPVVSIVNITPVLPSDRKAWPGANVSVGEEN